MEGGGGWGIFVMKFLARILGLRVIIFSVNWRAKVYQDTQACQVTEVGQDTKESQDTQVGESWWSNFSVQC